MNELIQRELTNRVSTIANYLRSQEQRFFNSIIIGVWGGQPDWLEIELLSTASLNLQDISEEAAENIASTLGLLRLSGREELFAIDGQHRIEAIRQAIKTNTSLAEEEVSVIFVGLDKSKAGRVRTRRLFSTLNRYAKAVSKGEIVSLDEDDAFAITTRRLVDEHSLLMDRRASPSKQTRIIKADRESFTTILTVYDIAQVLVLDSRPGWSKRNLTILRPSDDILDAIYQECATFWDMLSDTFPSVHRIVESNPGDQVAGKYRYDAGGSLLFRPIGQMAFARAIRILKDRRVPLKEAFAKLSSLQYNLEQPPWIGVLWNPISRNMITDPKSRDLAAELLIYYAGFETDRERLTRQYQAVTGSAEAILPNMERP